MITPDRARHIRAMMEKSSASLDDEDALTAVELFPVWKPGVSYAVDDRVSYEDVLYRVVQAHTSQEGWEPPVAKSLFADVAKPGEIPVWRQPTGSHDAYMMGEWVHYPDAEGPVYESIMDYNVYAPDVYGWQLVAAE